MKTTYQITFTTEINLSETEYEELFGNFTTIDSLSRILQNHFSEFDIVELQKVRSRSPNR